MVINDTGGTVLDWPITEQIIYLLTIIVPVGRELNQSKAFLDFPSIFILVLVISLVAYAVKKKKKRWSWGGPSLRDPEQGRAEWG